MMVREGACVTTSGNTMYLHRACACSINEVLDVDLECSAELPEVQPNCGGKIGPRARGARTRFREKIVGLKRDPLHYCTSLLS